MNRNLAARCIALFLIGICFAAYLYRDIEKTRRMGRHQFLEVQVAAQMIPLFSPF